MSGSPPLLDALLELVEEVQGQDGFPDVRAAVASGLALTRNADWLGSPVNVASRLTDVARRGTIVAEEGSNKRAEIVTTGRAASARR